jgi:hypothetical protein
LAKLDEILKDPDPQGYETEKEEDYDAKMVELMNKKGQYKDILELAKKKHYDSKEIETLGKSKGKQFNPTKIIKLSNRADQDKWLSRKAYTNHDDFLEKYKDNLKGYLETEKEKEGLDGKISEKRGEGIEIIIRDGVLYAVIDNEPESYVDFRENVKKPMMRLAERAKHQFKMEDSYVDEIIGSVDGCCNVLFPSLKDLKYFEIAKLYYESGFNKNAKHADGEKGIGAILPGTGRLLLPKLISRIEGLSDEEIGKMTPNMQRLAKELKSNSEYINRNLEAKLVEDMELNISLSTIYDYINLKMFDGNVYLAGMTYQQGERNMKRIIRDSGSRHRTIYITAINSLHEELTGEPIPAYVAVRTEK